VSGRNGVVADRLQNAALEVLVAPAAPHSLQAEQAVIGSILKQADSLTRVVDRLRTEHFYDPRHQRIWRAILTLHHRQVPADYHTIADELERQGTYVQSGGVQYLADINLATPTTAHIEHYARIVLECAARRRAIDQAQHAAELAYRPGSDMRSLADQLGQVAVALRAGDPVSGACEGTFTAAELMDMELPEPRWAVPDLVPCGLSLLAARPKFGKSWLTLQVALAVAGGGRALSQISVEQGPVLYLALEDNKRRLQERLKRLLAGSPAPAALHLETTWPRLDEGGYERLQRWLDAHRDTRLLVIDTWARLQPRPRQGANPYFEDSAAAIRLKAVADERQLAILAVHHTRKPFREGALADFLDEVLGSSGLPAIADTTLVLQRKRFKSEAVLHITGRDVVEQARALEWDELTGWSIGGDAETAEIHRQRRQVLQVLREEGRPMTPSEMAPLLDKGQSATKMMLRRMAHDGQLVVQRGRYALPEWSLRIADVSDPSDRVTGAPAEEPSEFKNDPREAESRSHLLEPNVTGNGAAASRNGAAGHSVTRSPSLRCLACGEVLGPADIRGGFGLHLDCRLDPGPAP
jgi:DnaB helicase-like protein/AAA domain-containing protein